MELNKFKSKEYLPLNHHNIAFKLIYLMILLMVFLSGKHEEFRVYTRKEANEICKQYVLSQKFYLNELDNEIISAGSSGYYRNINKYIMGLVNSKTDRLIEFMLFKQRLSNLIDSTEGLIEDTVLFRWENDEDILNRFEIGKINKFVGFISTSFYNGVGEMFSMKNNGGYLIIINAGKGTKGIAIDGVNIGKFKHQYEWLLNDGTEYITREIDYKKRIIKIDLI